MEQEDELVSLRSFFFGGDGGSALTDFALCANRYFFAATNYFLYGESLIYYFKHILTLQASFLPTAFSFAQHHRLISFGLYIIGRFCRHFPRGAR